MFSSPMSHFFRHALSAYSLQKPMGKRLLALRKLSAIEAQCRKLQQKHPESEKVRALLAQVGKIKAGL